MTVKPGNPGKGVPVGGPQGLKLPMSAPSSEGLYPIILWGPVWSLLRVLVLHITVMEDRKQVFVVEGF